ncbi:MAG: hypothetical protein Q8942_02575 [Bacillota bacterium]|nr:hypothetical protein [Bacillota bacterium]
MYRISFAFLTIASIFCILALSIAQGGPDWEVPTSVLLLVRISFFISFLSQIFCCFVLIIFKNKLISQVAKKVNIFIGVWFLMNIVLETVIVFCNPTQWPVRNKLLSQFLINQLAFLMIIPLLLFIILMVLSYIKPVHKT